MKDRQGACEIGVARQESKRLLSLGSGERPHPPGEHQADPDAHGAERPPPSADESRGSAPARSGAWVKQPCEAAEVGAWRAEPSAGARGQAVAGTPGLCLAVNKAPEAEHVSCLAAWAWASTDAAVAPGGPRRAGLSARAVKLPVEAEPASAPLGAGAAAPAWAWAWAWGRAERPGRSWAAEAVADGFARKVAGKGGAVRTCILNRHSETRALCSSPPIPSLGGRRGEQKTWWPDGPPPPSWKVPTTKGELAPPLCTPLADSPTACEATGTLACEAERDMRITCGDPSHCGAGTAGEQGAA